MRFILEWIFWSRFFGLDSILGRCIFFEIKIFFLGVKMYFEVEIFFNRDFRIHLIAIKVYLKIIFVEGYVASIMKIKVLVRDCQSGIF